MKRKNKRITRSLIRRYFGSDAKIRGFWGHYRITTGTGGEVVITPKTMRIEYGLDDTYRAVTLLAGECWGGITLNEGSREFMLGIMAHGEAAGVDVNPRFAKLRPNPAWLPVIAFLLWLGFTQGFDDPSWSPAALFLCLPLCFVDIYRRKKRAEAQQKAQQLGFHYPRVHGDAGAAQHDDAKNGGWL